MSLLSPKSYASAALPEPLGRDFVFADTAAAGQTVAMSGDPATGYSGTARVVLA